MSRKRGLRTHRKQPKPQKRGQVVMGKEDLKKAKIERGALRRLITRMLNNDSLDQLPLVGVVGTAKRMKVRNHNSALKQSWRQMERARGKYGQNPKEIPPPRLIYDSNQGPAARSTNVKTGEVTYVPWRTIAQ